MLYHAANSGFVPWIFYNNLNGGNMNKKLLTLAVGAALAGAVTVAQADVTVYGRAHVSLDKLDDGASTAGNDGAFVSSNSSRVGFKGDEDVGGGLKAVWQVESLVRLDGATSPATAATGTAQQFGGAWANRNSFVGMAGGFGTAVLGRHDTPFKLIGRAVDFFGDQVGDSRNIISIGSGATWDLRPNNVVAYISPSLGGVTVIAARVVDEGVVNFDATSISAQASFGSIWVGVAMENHGAGITGEPKDEEGQRVALKWSAGAITVAGLIQKTDKNAGIDKNKRSSEGVGVSYKFGNNTVKAQYYRAGKLMSAADTNGTLKAVGFDHALSKRTTVYAAYATASNKGTSTTFTADAGGHADTVGAAAGKSPKAISLGMIHDF